MKTKMFIAAFALFACQSGAQTILRGNITNLPAGITRQIVVEFWNVERWKLLETVDLSSDGAFSITLRSPIPGQYRLRLQKQSQLWNDFIVSDSTSTDTLLDFKLDYATLIGGPAKIANPEANTLYYNLLTEHQKFNKLREKNSRATADQIAVAASDFNRLCLEIASKHTNTMIGDVALLLYEPLLSNDRNNPGMATMSANAYAQSHALEKIPFHHENILYHNALYKQLNRYYNHFSHDTPGSIAYIDGVMARRNGNNAVDGFLFKYLLDNMMDFKQDEALTYLLTWFAPDCVDENPVPNGTKKLIEALKTCAPGNIAPDITFNKPDGKPASLGEACTKHKLTLMLLWRSNCSHCREFLPELEKLYQKYHPLGLEVYALSTDNTEEDWRNFLQKQPTSWINVFVTPERRNDVMRTYPSASTPALIALDKNRRVLSRVLSRENLEAYIEEVLREQ